MIRLLMRVREGPTQPEIKARARAATETLWPCLFQLHVGGNKNQGNRTGDRSIVKY